MKRGVWIVERRLPLSRVWQTVHDFGGIVVRSSRAEAETDMRYRSANYHYRAVRYVPALPTPPPRKKKR